MGSTRTRVIIMGAAGRDFHDFNVVYRDDPDHEVVAFTAAQIPGIADRCYPPELSGPLYPEGIPIVPEETLEHVCREHGVTRVIFAYSDLPHARVMHLASRALAAGADFELLGPERTMLAAPVPVIAVSAVRTGCGKSQTARFLSRALRERQLRVAVIRHPMPYGDLARQAVQRFETPEDLAAADCTVEEREEYEPHLAAGNVVFAGVDYARIVERAGAESDLILWDGGNNDFPFVRPSYHVVLVDPLRPGDETTHHPGEAVLRMADVVVIPKVDVADADSVEQVCSNARAVNPDALQVRAASPVVLDPEGSLEGRRALVVEDGPTLTHGGMPYGAGTVAAKAAGAQLVDPRPWAAPAIAEVFRRYPHLGPVLPAVGYGSDQLGALGETIRAAEADVVVASTPIDLAALVETGKPVVRARYRYADAGEPTLLELVDTFLAEGQL